MNVILDQKLYDQLWDKMLGEYQFRPKWNPDGKPFSIPHPYRLYRLGERCWTQEQEARVNEIFEALVPEDGYLYALDWNHDCFIFNPRERIPLDYHYYDEERAVNVYFPSYYPNGDFYFFIAADWSFGLLGHPWRRELYLWGDELTARIERLAGYLDLQKIHFGLAGDISQTSAKAGK